MDFTQTQKNYQNPPDDEILRFWSLTVEDLKFISDTCLAPSLRVWLGLQLCFLRKNGCLAKNESEFPAKTIPWMNRQFSVSPHIILEVPKRPNTWSTQRDALLAYLGWIDFDENHEKYNMFIKENVLNGKSKSEILELLTDFLKSEKIIPPISKKEMERFLGGSIEKVSDELELNAYSLLPKLLVDQLNEMLFGTDQNSNYFGIFDKLRMTPPSPSRNKFQALVTLEKNVRPMLESGKALESILSEKMIQEYAESANKWSKWELKRFSEEKRSIILACFVIHSYACLLDNIVLMFDRLVSKMENKVIKTWNEFIIKKSQTNLENRKLILLAAEIFSKSTESELIAAHKKFDHAALIKALEDRSSRGDRDEEDKAEIMSRMEKQFRPILNNFLGLDFKTAKGLNKLTEIVEFARKKQTLPIDKSQHHYIEKKYQSYATTPDNKWRRDIWSWFLIQEIRTRLRTQDIFFPNSLKNKGVWNSLINTKIPIPIHNTKEINAIDELLKDYEKELELFKDSLSTNSYAKIVNGNLQLSRDKALPDPVSDKFRASVMSVIGRIRIEDLFQEIEAQTNFSSAFRHHSSNEPISKSRHHVLHAVLIAQATNLGLTGMASATEGITADMLDDINRCYLSPENIKEAIRRVVNYQASLEVGNMYGLGEISSSDGQLFPVRGKSLAVEYHPRRFGWMKRGINVYSHISDRYTVFSSIVLSCSVREWVAVIDGLLDNDTVLNPRIHTTDTHGYTDHMFSLSWLLGFTFAPRIRDLGGTRLWLPQGINVGELSTIFESQKVSLDGLKANWELAQRVTAALKHKLVDGRTICMRLSNSTSDPLAKALLDAGRIIKTTFLLRWMRDTEFRRPLNAQLNKGESRQELARNVNFASGSGLRSADHVDLMNRTSVLALACNIIVAWNTRQIEKTFAQMKLDNSLQENTDFSSLSPLIHEHIIRTGTYHFKQMEAIDAH